MVTTFRKHTQGVFDNSENGLPTLRITSLIIRFELPKFGFPAHTFTFYDGNRNLRNILAEIGGVVRGHAGNFFLSRLGGGSFAVDVGCLFSAEAANRWIDADLEIWGAGIGTEFKFISVPDSAFANLDWITASFGSGQNLENTRAFAGLKLNLGTETLIERDRHGTSLDPIPYEAPI